MYKKFIPKKIYLWWKERNFRSLRKKTPEEIFSDVYNQNTWGGNKGTFYSGAGTANPNTIIYLDHLTSFIKENNIQKILEIGCGDFSIMKQLTSQVKIDYTGGDVVEALIRHNQSVFQNEHTRFIHLNAITDDLPGADLVIIRQVLQHLSNPQIMKILNKLTRFKYALITEHVPVTDDAEYNLDKIAGPHIRMRVNSGVFIDKPPFNMKNVKVLFEYREDDKVKQKMVPAVMRTYLLEN
ncbi:MAG: class I SAM-dependent methyltransferase [Chitinophagaceae bacterium]